VASALKYVPCKRIRHTPNFLSFSTRKQALRDELWNPQTTKKGVMFLKYDSKFKIKTARRKTHLSPCYLPDATQDVLPHQISLNLDKIREKR
jgi:hypothetical protein